MQNSSNEESTLSKFDRQFAGLQGGNNPPTKPTTIEHVAMTGETETFIIQTFRDEKGDSIVIKFVDKEGVKRIICPPRVAKAIAAQRDSLTKSRRRINGKTAAQARKDRGELPGFQRTKIAQTKTDDAPPVGARQMVSLFARRSLPVAPRETAAGTGRSRPLAENQRRQRP
jgi:hypothetical protein